MIKDMGMPEILINFKSKGIQAIKNSERGIVLLILKDKFDKEETVKSILDVSKDYNEQNKQYIKDTFIEAPSRVLIKTFKNESKLTDVLKELKVKKWNYLAMPGASEDEVNEIATFIKEIRKKNHIGKAVLANIKADCEGIINFTTTGIKIKERDVTTQEYTCRLASIFATIPLTRSATFFILPEITSIDLIENEDEKINAGELILTNDSENIKIARAINSKTTITTNESEQLKKIKVIEGMDMIKEDIRNTFNKNYVGKIINDYDNKMLFFSSIKNGYFKQLAKIGVLDRSFENTCYLDIPTQKEYLAGKGIDIEKMSDIEIQQANTEEKVFAAANIKFVDVIEDLQFNINY